MENVPHGHFLYLAFSFVKNSLCKQFGDDETEEKTGKWIVLRAVFLAERGKEGRRNSAGGIGDFFTENKCQETKFFLNALVKGFMKSAGGVSKHFREGGECEIAPLQSYGHATCYIVNTIFQCNL